MTLGTEHLLARKPSANEEFITAMRNVATGVTVVASEGPGGRYAQTVSAMCSVSADPPSLLVCVNVRSPLADAVCRNGVFAVNVLGAGQAHVCDTFAGRPAAGEPYDFGCARWRQLRTGSPVLDGAAAVFDCRLADSTRTGTHLILVGTVLASTVSAEVPLLYHARAYGTHRPIDQQGAQAR
jgi:flavin reductase (DIM6/NTAB) family NADH-FMN oxidoreductase RutF